jgi:hypothetical protein
MSSSLTARQGAAAALAIVSAIAMLLVGFQIGSANAADVTSGNAAFKITSGKAGKVSAIKPARVAKRFGKGAKVTANLKRGGFNKVVRSGIAGGIKLASGKRRVKITGLTVAIYAKRAVIRGKLAGKKLNVFAASGKAKLDKPGRTARLNGARLTLTGKAARQIRKKLKLKKAPKGKLGTFSLNLKVTSDTPVDPCVTDPDAEGCEITDPYLAQCGVDAVVKVPGSITPADAVPEFTNQTGASGPANLAWGFKSSFRSYATTIAGGSIHALDGAVTTGTAPSFSGFEFPAAGFRYTDNGTPADLSDDKAVLEGSGTALFCATAHGFRVAVSNPTIVIDGADSRIDADVDANLSGNWIPNQRVTIADLDVSKVSRMNGETGSIEKWLDAPATLTTEGSQAICGVGELDKCSTFYPAGTVLDPVSVEVNLPDQLTGVEDQFNDECGVPVAGISNNSWVGASSLPTLANPVPASAAGGIQWGLASSFRGYVYGFMAGSTPPPDLSAKALQALDGASRFPTTPPGSFDPTRGFMFPVTHGQYAANSAATDDDQAVLDGSGTALFCNSKHSFWVSISNPTIVIDGANSRIVADLSQNTRGPGPVGSEPWQTTQRVDLADLDLSGVTPTYGTGTVEWADVPVTLSEEASPFATYSTTPEAPKTLDPITISLETE